MPEQDTAVLPLIRGTGMLTLGSQKKDIDFEPEWRRRMQDCQTSGGQPQKPKGNQTCSSAAQQHNTTANMLACKSSLWYAPAHMYECHQGALLSFTVLEG